MNAAIFGATFSSGARTKLSRYAVVQDASLTGYRVVDLDTGRRSEIQSREEAQEWADIANGVQP